VVGVVLLLLAFLAEEGQNTVIYVRFAKGTVYNGVFFS